MQLLAPGDSDRSLECYMRTVSGMHWVQRMEVDGILAASKASVEKHVLRRVLFTEIFTVM